MDSTAELSSSPEFMPLGCKAEYLEAMVELVKVGKIYPPDIAALDDVSFQVGKGEILYLTGASGAGKSTLLKLLYSMERPSSGLIKVAGRDLFRLKQKEIQALRQKIGVAYQDFRLLNEQSVARNVGMAMEVAYVGSKAIRARTEILLELLQIADKRDKVVGSLSRGEQQRVALARAAANRPNLLLADEPTGNLDRETGALVARFFKILNNDEGCTIIIATHDRALYADGEHRVIDLHKGRLRFFPDKRPRQIDLFP